MVALVVKAADLYVVGHIGLELWRHRMGRSELEV